MICKRAFLFNASIRKLDIPHSERLTSAKPACRMGQHGIDLTGVRGEVGLGDRLVTICLGNVRQQLFEISDIAIHGGAEFRFAVVFALDFVKGLLTLQRVETAGEHIALAALVAPPQVH